MTLALALGAGCAHFGPVSVRWGYDSVGRFVNRSCSARWLPGEVWDEETGLHYNRQRYYDPEHGQYLTPDPLGTPDGPNPYAYVAFNPLTNIDPDGLILFAFDGTDNSRDAREYERLAGAPTNVARFAAIYNDGIDRYVSGVGTRHFEEGNLNYLDEDYRDIVPTGFGPIPDRGGNYTGRQRIQRMWDYFLDEAQLLEDDSVMPIDIVGFSRGAAQAREFANRLAAATTVINGVQYVHYDAIDRSSRRPYLACQAVNLRFMGLFDTVLSTDLGNGPEYRLGIPAAFGHVAHAVALNEYRSQPYSWDILGYPFNAAFWDSTRRNLDNNLHQGGFTLESIGAGQISPGQVRVERGFIGAHADIGGGYLESNELSLVALHWMVAQARTAGVNMDGSRLQELPTTNPVLHDQSNALRIGDPRSSPLVQVEAGEGDAAYNTWVNLQAEDRSVRRSPYGTQQRSLGFTDFGPSDRSLTNAEAHAQNFITYTPRPTTSNPADTWPSLAGNETGTVDIARYLQWLNDNGYALVNATAPSSAITTTAASTGAATR